jgi:hypothetical protein
MSFPVFGQTEVAFSGVEKTTQNFHIFIPNLWKMLKDGQLLIKGCGKPLISGESAA